MSINKIKVNYAELSQMLKYNPNFPLEFIEETIEESDPRFTVYARKFYNDNLPVDIITWLGMNDAGEATSWEKKQKEQIYFVKNTIMKIFFPTYNEWSEHTVLVLATHTIKSVLLPIYQLKLAKYGIEMVLRGDFTDWILSVNSEKELSLDKTLSNQEELDFKKYKEIPKSKLYSSYSKNQKKFTVRIRNDYELFTFMFLLEKQLKKS